MHWIYSQQFTSLMRLASNWRIVLTCPQHDTLAWWPLTAALPLT